MFCTAFCLFVSLCGCANGGESSSIEVNHPVLIKNSSAGDQVKYVLQKEKSSKIMSTLNNGETRTKKISKRGIVMVDSDFDIPSEIYTYENNLHGDAFGKNEGSGSDEFEEESIKSTGNIKPEYRNETNISTFLTLSSTKSMVPTIRELQNITTSITAEGSGDDIIIITEEYSTTETAEEYSTTETNEEHSITNTRKYSTKITGEYSTTAIPTKNHTGLENDVQEKIPNICMNSTCDLNDLLTFTSEERSFIPEDTNLTLTCINNGSNHNMLYWYKSNGSMFFLQAFSTKGELHLNIPVTKSIHSGMYICVKWVNKQTCCNSKSAITIYEVPLYKYHLVIIGLLTFAGLFLCIFLSVRQSIALKIYTKHFAKKHGSVKHQLL